MASQVPALMQAFFIKLQKKLETPDTMGILAAYHQGDLMFINSQLEPLFSMIDALSKIDDSVAALKAEAERLRALKQRLTLGWHEHRHGRSDYLFLVPEGKVFSEDDLVAHMEEEFEPEKDESLSVDSIDEPIVFEGSSSKCIEIACKGFVGDGEHEDLILWVMAPSVDYVARAVECVKDKIQSICLTEHELDLDDDSIDAVLPRDASLLVETIRMRVAD
jgi:hypothetical protein